MKKKLLIILLVVVILIGAAVTFLVCSRKKAITKDEFVSKAKEYGLSVQEADVDEDFVKSATIAYKGTISFIVSEGSFKPDWQVEFYEIDTEENAKSMYAGNKSNYENTSDSGGSASISVNAGNYSYFEKTADGHYVYISRVDTTLLYLNVSEEYKADVKEFVKKLGY